MAESKKPMNKLPSSSEDIVGKQPLVTDDKGKEYIPEIRKKRTQASARKKLYGKE